MSNLPVGGIQGGKKPAVKRGVSVDNRFCIPCAAPRHPHMSGYRHLTNPVFSLPLHVDFGGIEIEGGHTISAPLHRTPLLARLIVSSPCRIGSSSTNSLLLHPHSHPAMDYMGSIAVLLSISPATEGNDAPVERDSNPKGSDSSQYGYCVVA